MTRREPDNARLDRVVAAARRERDEREKGYRERALRLYPWVCGRCGREFTHANLIELTVHHRDHDHDNNPLDGSNWELLCRYCHDDEHARAVAAHAEIRKAGTQSASTYRPFANLKSKLTPRK